jgi:hypothetical protein
MYLAIGKAGSAGPASGLASPDRALYHASQDLNQE